MADVQKQRTVEISHSLQETIIVWLQDNATPPTTFDQEVLVIRHIDDDKVETFAYAVDDMDIHPMNDEDDSHFIGTQESHDGAPVLEYELLHKTGATALEKAVMDTINDDVRSYSLNGGCLADIRRDIEKSDTMPGLTYYHEGVDFHHRHASEIEDLINELLSEEIITMESLTGEVGYSQVAIMFNASTIAFKETANRLFDEAEVY